jgi:hypothetical protein
MCSGSAAAKAALIGACLALGCSPESPGTGTGTGGSGTGGVTAAGGAQPATGGTSLSTGGVPATGGTGPNATGGTASGGKAAGGSTTGGAPAGGSASGGKPAGGTATGGALTGGAASGGKATGGVTTGGAASGGKATGGTSTGGSATGGKATGGSATGGAGTGGGSTGSVFSQCRFHFGTIDTVAKNAGSSMISQIDFFTPGWMLGTFNQGYVCTESASGGALAGKLPIDVTYIAANYVKSNHGLCDCNVTTCGTSGGRANDLCNYGAQYITQDWAAILSAYSSNSTGFANCLGGRAIVFEMEPDWYQYTISNQTQPWTAAKAGTNMTALVNALKASLPQARFSMDISPWIANNGSAWYTNFDMSLFTFINTSGGGTDANNTRIRSGNTMTWAGVNQVTGKPILADTGYGAAGASAGEDPNWNVAANINARIADGVISISQYNPTSGWGNTISGLRSQLNTPRYCP